MIPWGLPRLQQASRKAYSGLPSSRKQSSSYRLTTKYTRPITASRNAATSSPICIRFFSSRVPKNNARTKIMGTAIPKTVILSAYQLRLYRSIPLAPLPQRLFDRTLSLTYRIKEHLLRAARLIRLCSAASNWAPIT